MLKARYILSKRSLNSLNGVHPNLVTVIKTAISNSPFDFVVVQGVRSTEEQKVLYAQGRTVKGKIVTNCDGVVKKSNHQAKADGYGYAIDFAIYDPTIPGKIDWDITYKYIAVATHIISIAKELGYKVESGKDWKKFKDYPHIELKR